MVFTDLSPQFISITASPGSGYTMVMPETPVSQAVVSLAEIEATEGDEPPLPVSVSFQGDVMPIFERRGCVGCHGQSGAGREDGGLSLKGNNNAIYSELTEELSPQRGVLRVNLADPPASLLLAMPGPAPDSHPNITFASSFDVDYQLILAWIQEGALDN